MKRIALALVTFAACSSPAPAQDSVESLRDRLAEPAQWTIAASPDAGALDAAHYADGSWQSGSAAIAITSGQLATGVDPVSGALMVTALEVSFAPIAIPPTVFGSAGELTGVALALPSPVAATATWTDDDHASVAASLALSLSWSLAVDGSTVPLGAQPLPPLPLELTIARDGSSAGAELALHGDGDLWSWADLLKLTSLDVAADATLADPGAP